MYKKLIIPLILALVTTMSFSSVAYAANKPDSTSYVRYVGTILSVDTSALTIRLATLKGQSLTIHVDSNTVYRGLAGSLADLAPSMYVNVRAKQLPNGSYLAVLVNALKKQVVLRVTGQVTHVYSSSFSILGTDGNTYTFDVTAKTSFSGFDVTDLTELQVGMKVKVGYLNMGNGILRALTVTVTQLHAKINGKVTAKDSSSFTILGGDGNSYTFQVTTKTSFSGNGVTGFSGLKIGMKVNVTYATLTDGTLRAKNVIIVGR